MPVNVSLAGVLAIGNETGGNDIVVLPTDAIASTGALSLASAGSTDVTITAQATAYNFSASGAALTTTAQDIVGALNELDAAIGGGGSTLSAVLAAGNTTGANSIVFDTASQTIQGSDAATPIGFTIRGGDASSGSVNAGADLTIKGGDGDQVGFGGGAGGSVTISGGEADPSGTDSGGFLILNGGGGYLAGGINLNAVAGAFGGDDGAVSVTAPYISLLSIAGGGGGTALQIDAELDAAGGTVNIGTQNNPAINIGDTTGAVTLGSFLNVGPAAAAVALGDVAAGDGTRELFWDASGGDFRAGSGAGASGGNEIRWTGDSNPNFSIDYNAASAAEQRTAFRLNAYRSAGTSAGFGPAIVCNAANSAGALRTQTQITSTWSNPLDADLAAVMDFMIGHRNNPDNGLITPVIVQIGDPGGGQGLSIRDNSDDLLANVERFRMNADTGVLELYNSSSATRIQLSDTGFANIGSTTAAAALGDVAAGSSTRTMHWEESLAFLRATNTNSAERALVHVRNDSSTGISMWATGSTRTPTVTWDTASTGVISNDSALTGGMILTVTAAAPIRFGTTSIPRWQIDASGHLLSATGVDNTHDIGASGATRPRTGYFGTALNVGNGITPSTANGDIVAGDGTRQFSYDASTGGVTISGISTNSFGHSVTGTVDGNISSLVENLNTGSSGLASVTVSNSVGMAAFAVASAAYASSAYKASAVNITTSSALTGGIRFNAAATNAAASIDFATDDVDRWSVQSGPSGGHLVAATDNTYDIGASGATRPRSVYAGTSIVSPALSSAGALTVTSDTTSAVTVDSGTTGDVNLGTGAAAKSVSVGNATGATGVSVDSGSGGITLTTASGGSITLLSDGVMALDTGSGTITTDATAFTADAGLAISTTSTGVLTLDSGTTGAVNLGTGASAKTVTVGNTTGATAVAYDAGTGGHTFTGDIGFYGTSPVAQAAAITALTDSSGGSANDTVAAVSGSGDDATINDNFADLSAKINSILTVISGVGLTA